ncbi:hypothetical protein B0T16DRAFT_384296 [Cercophora newfieldiana]|uniref:Uncharacterized protein n=1 Tax=Cercophora newfieldiana TaxID=92897 RepID=A0AA39YMR5_9PEZI|nr:hypothetical protein B0T16DRAFT_384296 [Cercophora newfieldiana]
MPPDNKIPVLTCEKFQLDHKWVNEAFPTAKICPLCGKRLPPFHPLDESLLIGSRCQTTKILHSGFREVAPNATFCMACGDDIDDINLPSTTPVQQPPAPPPRIHPNYEAEVIEISDSPLTTSSPKPLLSTRPNDSIENPRRPPPIQVAQTQPAESTTRSRLSAAVVATGGLRTQAQVMGHLVREQLMAHRKSKSRPPAAKEPPLTSTAKLQIWTCSYIAKPFLETTFQAWQPPLEEIHSTGTFQIPNGITWPNLGAFVDYLIDEVVNLDNNVPLSSARAELVSSAMTKNKKPYIEKLVIKKNDPVTWPELRTHWSSSGGDTEKAQAVTCIHMLVPNEITEDLESSPVVNADDSDNSAVPVTPTPAKKKIVVASRQAVNKKGVLSKGGEGIGSETSQPSSTRGKGKGKTTADAKLGQKAPDVSVPQERPTRARKLTEKMKEMKAQQQQGTSRGKRGGKASDVAIKQEQDQMVKVKEEVLPGVGKHGRSASMAASRAVEPRGKRQRQLSGASGDDDAASMASLGDYEFGELDGSGVVAETLNPFLSPDWGLTPARAALEAAIEGLEDISDIEGGY